jgi:hypothetical protein
MMINNIIQAIYSNRIIVSRHAKEEAESDNLFIDEINFAVIEGEIIEDYPDDPRGHSCLIYGHNQNGDPIHSVSGYNEDTAYAVLITVYRPDPNQWVNFRFRKT